MESAGDLIEKKQADFPYWLKIIGKSRRPIPFPSLLLYRCSPAGYAKDGLKNSKQKQFSPEHREVTSGGFYFGHFLFEHLNLFRISDFEFSYRRELALPVPFKRRSV